MGWRVGGWQTGCAVLLLCAGCLNPATTRMPTFWNGSPEAERQEFSRHDPLPDTTLGPDTGARPRDADIMRDEAPRVRDSTVPRNGNTLDPANPAGLPSAARTYPNTVMP